MITEMFDVCLTSLNQEDIIVNKNNDIFRR